MEQMELISFIKAIALSWLDALRAFLPPTSKQFMHLTINSWRMLWQASIASGGIIFLIGLWGLTIYMRFCFDWKIAVIIFFVAATRPTISVKNTDYFVRATIISISAGILMHMIRCIFQLINLSLLANIWFYSSLFIFGLDTITSAFCIISVLFFFDSKRRLRDICVSLVRALKMIVLNYPFFLIMHIAVNIVMGLLIGISNFIDHWYILFSVTIINLLFTIPLYISALTNFYIKRIHEQFQVYYDVY
jgi:hypothetical protein